MQSLLYEEVDETLTGRTQDRLDELRINISLIGRDEVHIDVLLNPVVDQSG